MKQMWKGLVLFILFICSIIAVSAQSEEEIEEGRTIVAAKTSCEDLTDEQLEAVGEYYMEQIHPGALHDAMHEVMGIEEGTEEHKQFHITLAKRMYCGEGSYTMMGYNNGLGYGMMSMMYAGAWRYSFWSFWNLTYMVFFAFIFALIFWGVYTLLIKKRGKK